MTNEPAREKPRRWKKGHGTYARMKAAGLAPALSDVVVMDEAKKLDITAWMDEQADKALTIVFDENGDEV